MASKSRFLAQDEDNEAYLNKNVIRQLRITKTKLEKFINDIEE